MRGLIIDPAVNGCRAVNLLLIAVKAWGRGGRSIELMMRRLC
jgi:hypothetical protein